MAKNSKNANKEPALPFYRMRLFIAGEEPNSLAAKVNMRSLCEIYLQNRAHLEIIDVFEDFEIAVKEKVLITPMLIVYKPFQTKLYGNLNQTDKVLKALHLL